MKDIGRRWARFTLLLSLAVSIAANIGHTITVRSDIPVGWRIVGAVWWPIATLLAVEILLQVNWTAGRGSHVLARVFLLVVAPIAAISSYEHMRTVLLLMGEHVFIADIGPGAVDVLMIGCTMTLIFTKLTGEADAAPAGTPALLAYDYARPIGPEPLPEFSLEQLTTPGALPEAPVSPAPAGVRRPRNPDAMSTAVQQITTGQSVTAVSDASAKRLVRVWRELRNNPNATIPADWKVTGELVEKMRSAARTEINR